MKRLTAKIMCRMMARYDAKCEKDAPEADDGVTVTRDIPVPGGQSVDIYSPVGAEALPVVLDVHGGGLVYGDKKLNGRFCRAIAALGFTVASAEYRLAPHADYPAMISDVARAAAFAQSRDGSGKFYLAGDSAGAQLALVADAAAGSEKVRDAFGLKAGDVGRQADGLFLVSGAFAFGKRGVRALAGLSVGNGDWQRFTDAETLLGEYSPRRIFLSSGESDSLQRLTLRFSRLLCRLGIPHELDFTQNTRGTRYVHVWPVRRPERAENAALIARAMSFLRSPGDTDPAV